MNPRIGGGAAVVGGLFWLVKAAAILLTGDQPPMLFEAAPIFFGLGIIGLRNLLPDRDSPLALSSLIVACLAIAATVAALVTTELGGATSEDDFSPFIFASFIAMLVALTLGAIPTWRKRALQPPWHLAPITLAASFIPLVAVGGVLEGINERLLEVPILILGFGWILVGYASATKSSYSSRPS